MIKKILFFFVIFTLVCVYTKTTKGEGGGDPCQGLSGQDLCYCDDAIDCCGFSGCDPIVNTGPQCAGPNDCPGGECCNGGQCGSCGPDSQIANGCPVGYTMNCDNAIYNPICPASIMVPWGVMSWNDCVGLYNPPERAIWTGFPPYSVDCGTPVWDEESEQLIGVGTTYCFHCDCYPSCSLTKPAITDITQTSITSATVSWSPGSGGYYHNLYVGANANSVINRCVDGSCAFVLTGIGNGTTSYNTGFNLAPGTIYYYMIENYLDGSCNVASATAAAMSSCEMSPLSGTLAVGQTATYTSTATNSPLITSVTFTPSNSNISLNPTLDTTYLYQTAITAQAAGTAFFTENIYSAYSATPICSAKVNITIIDPDPWWQVIDSDVQTSGNLSSNVPNGGVFNMGGYGGYPGLPVASSTSLNNTNVSEYGWLSESGITTPKIYDFQYFNKNIPDDTIVNTLTSSTIDSTSFYSGTISSDGYYWYKYTASGGVDLTINSDISIGNKRVILIIENGGLNIVGKVNLDDGVGFFMAVVNDNITIDQAVGGDADYLPEIEGIYIADGVISTGAGNTQLHVRGSVVGYGGINLQRDLIGVANQSAPAELFEYAADQILLFPIKIGSRRIVWKEIAP